jgi:hypothetical protein
VQPLNKPVPTPAMDIGRDVRSPIDYVGAIDDEYQVLLTRDLCGRGARLIDQRLEQLILLVGDGLVELLIDLLFVGRGFRLGDLGRKILALLRGELRHFVVSRLDLWNRVERALVDETDIRRGR